MLKKFLTDQIVMGANVPLPANSPFGSLAACWGEIIQLLLIPTQKKMRNLLIDLIVSPAPQLFSVSSSLFVDVCSGGISGQTTSHNWRPDGEMANTAISWRRTWREEAEPEKIMLGL